MSDFNPMKNPEIAAKTNAQKRRAVIIGGIEYASLLIAAEILGVCEHTIRQWCKKGINPQREKCRYKDEPQKEYTGRYNKGQCKPIIYDGVRYECAVDLAKELGVDNSTVGLWVKKGIASNGKTCVFEENIIKNGQDNQQPSRGNFDNSTSEGSTTNG